MSFASWTLADEGMVDGVQYVTVLNETFDPIEYEVPESQAREDYGLTLERNRYEEDE